MNFFKKNSALILFLLFIFAVSVWGYILYLRQKEINNKVPLIVTDSINVFAPDEKNIVVSHNHIGRVEAINDTLIKPYTNGYVTKVNVLGGQQVKKGEVLITLQQDEYKAALFAATAEIFAANANLINAQTKYKRMQNAGPEAISPTELDDAKNAYLDAKASLKKAQANYVIAQTNLDYTELTAPFEGIVGNIATSVGDFVSPQGEQILRLVQFNPIRVVFSVSDKEYLNSIGKQSKENISFKVQLANGEILLTKGKLKYTSNAVDINTNSVAIYTEFENKEKLLMPDASVNILQEIEYKNVILLPKNLMILKPDGDYVYTVLNDILQMHKLDYVTEYNDKVLVRNNFQANEFIVADTVDTLQIGKKVHINQVTVE